MQNLELAKSQVCNEWPVHTPRDIGYFGMVYIFLTSWYKPYGIKSISRYRIYWRYEIVGHSMVTFVTKIWEFFTFNWSQLLQQTSYQSFRGWCTKYLGWSIHSNPPQKKFNLGQGQAQCPCNARLRLWLRTKVGSASESLQSPISVKCDRVIYIFDGRHIAKHFTTLNMEIHFAL